MAMAESTSTDFLDDKIAAYFKKIHDELIWPTLSSSPTVPPVPPHPKVLRRPERLVDFYRLLINSYAKTVVVFGKPRSCSCRSDAGDIREDRNRLERGGAGLDLPAPSGQVVAFSEEERRPCNEDEDCKQTEVCSDPPERFCVPGPMSLLANTPVLDYPKDQGGAELSQSIQDYFAQIHELIRIGLRQNPRRLPHVRDLLIGIYAGAAVIALKDPTPCVTSSDCDQDKVCVNKICVPIPFSLVFAPVGRAYKSAWV